jgi:hypothetical protein
MPTKAELENQIESLEQDLRRVKRALGQAELDLDITHIEIKDHITPAASDQMKEVLSTSAGLGKKHMYKMVNLLGAVLLLPFAILKQTLTLERKYSQVVIDYIAIGGKHLAR